MAGKRLLTAHRGDDLQLLLPYQAFLLHFLLQDMDTQGHTGTHRDHTLLTTHLQEMKEQ